MNKLSLGLILGLFVIFSPGYAEVNPESIIQIFQRLEMLEKKTRELHGENEVLKHQIEQLKKVQKQGFLNVDERIDELSNSLKSTPDTEVKAEEKTSETTTDDAKNQAELKVVETEATKPAAETSKESTQEMPRLQPQPADTSAEAKPDASKATTETKTEAATKTPPKNSRAPTAYEKETYQAAFNKMNASPTAATKAFQEYIKMQPNSPLAANAQYWIGEIMYSHNNYKGAVQEFIKVLQKYKYSNKAPDAAIKLGYSFYALKNWPYARRTFEDVLKYFPENKNAVKLATQRLEKMTAAGH